MASLAAAIHCKSAAVSLCLLFVTPLPVQCPPGPAGSSLATRVTLDDSTEGACGHWRNEAMIHRPQAAGSAGLFEESGNRPADKPADE